MAWKIYLSDNLLLKPPSNQQGVLIAAADGDKQSVAVVGSVPVPTGEFAEAVAVLAQHLPQGLLAAGSYTSAAGPAPWQPSNVPVAVTAVNTAADTAKWSVNGQPVAQVETISSTEDAGLNILPGHVPLRCHLAVQICVPVSNSSTNNSNNNTSKLTAAAVKAAFSQLQQSLLTDQLAFVTDNNMQQQPRVLLTPSSKTSIQDLLGSDRCSSSQPCISLLLLQHTGHSSRQQFSSNSAPLFECKPYQQQQQVAAVDLGLDVLCYVPLDMQAGAAVQTLLAPALQSQLLVMQQQLLQQVAEGQPLTPVKAYHFQPPALGGLPITICYPMLHESAETTELKLLGMRQQLHSLFGLPDNVPMLRISNALDWEAAWDDTQTVGRAVRLRNVHEGLAQPGGQLYLIDGAYDYYHYMQDRFNDNGWGCAYRSLQTIISWFRLQKYTSKPVPTHKQIQEILVSLGDKESSFVGSSQWIGAIELSYILDEYLGITSKILTVNKGSDIPSNARALAQHFATQGTPVMIGGGVLAYTLLGVAFDEDTGDAAFLILDPHYTGGEDLKKIQQGTWVAWKRLGDNAAAGGPLFVKDAFYNFLCPQRPQTV